MCFEINSTRLARFHQSDIRLDTVLCLSMPITEGVILLFDAVSSYDGPSLRRRSNHSSPSLLIPGRGQQKDSFPRSNRLGEKPLVIFFSTDLCRASGLVQSYPRSLLRQPACRGYIAALTVGFCERSWSPALDFEREFASR